MPTFMGVHISVFSLNFRKRIKVENTICRIISFCCLKIFTEIQKRKKCELY